MTAKAVKDFPDPDSPGISSVQIQMDVGHQVRTVVETQVQALDLEEQVLGTVRGRFHQGYCWINQYDRR
jgi:hypothetical protein